MRFTAIGRPIRIQARQLLFRSTKIINSLRPALTLVFLGSISQLLAGTEMDLKTSPSPTDENKNSTEIFNYETTYTGTSDYQKYRGIFGESDSLYSDFSYAHRFLITGNWYLRLGVEYERFDLGGDNGHSRLAVPGCISCATV